MSVLDRFENGMSHEDMVLGLLSTEASLKEEDAKRALLVLKQAYAHELAEKQRQRLADEGYELGCVCGGCSCCLATEFIDLIDPKKEGQ